MVTVNWQMPISSAGLTLLKHTVIGALLLSKFKDCEHLEYLRDFYSIVPSHDKDLASKPQISSNLQYKKIQERLLALTVSRVSQ